MHHFVCYFLFCVRHTLFKLNLVQIRCLHIGIETLGPDSAKTWDLFQSERQKPSDDGGCFRR